jgi:hypothetical protein
MGIWGWAAAIAAGWFTSSLVFAAAWALGGNKILRPAPRIVRNDGEPISQREVDAVFALMTLDAELRGLRDER